MTVRGSIQCPYYVHRALKVSFGLPDEQVRVIQAETGGAFGGKEDYPSLLAGHAALLAMKAGRPVKMIYDRGEDMASTTKRHPSRTRHRTAVSKEGKLLAAEVEIVIDGGAYATLSATVCSRATIHACGPYQWPAVRVHSQAVATNNPPSGRFAALARRSRCLRWSGTWTRLRAWWGLRRKSCGGATSSRPAAPPRPAS